MNKPTESSITKQTTPRVEQLLVVLIIALSLVKLVNIELVPIFLDEAYYLSEAGKITQDIHNLFITIPDAVQLPVMIWILALVNITTHSFASLLISGRTISVLSDIGSAILIFFIGREFWDRRYGLLGALIYLSLPLTFLHSRFVLLESMTNLFSLIAIYFIIKNVKEAKKVNSLSKNLQLAAFMILAFFTKPLAAISFVAVSLWPIFFTLKEGSVKFKVKDFFNSYKKILPGFLLAVLIILVLFLPIENAFSVNYLSFTSHVSSGPLLGFKTNLHKTWLWTESYITLPVLLPVCVTVLYSIFKKRWRFIWISMWLMIVAVLDSLLDKNLYPRHLYPMAAPVSLLAAYSIYQAARFNKYLPFLLILFVLLLPWKKNFQLLSNPALTMAREDRTQFYEERSSGVGIREVAQKLHGLSKDKYIDVFVENEPLTSWALSNLYNVGKARIHPDNIMLINKGTLCLTLEREYSNKDTYVVVNDSLDVPRNCKFKLVASYPKGPDRSIKIYRYTSNN